MNERSAGEPGLASPLPFGLVGSAGDQPGLIVVDLDAPSAALDRVPVVFAGVVVGLSRRAPTVGSRPDVAAGVDFVLVPEERAPTGPSPRAAWVAVADLDAEVARLDEAVTSSPVAAAVLMQVLRASSEPSIEHDLLVESLAYSALQAGADHRSWLAGRPQRRSHGDQLGPPVMLERTDGILTITVNRPQVRNAYNVEVRDGLHEAFELVALDPSIEEVALVGVGPDFCSGGDLDEFGSGPGPGTSHLIRTTCSPALGLARVASRVTAHLHGACVGAGIELPALSGRIVAAPDTRIRLPEVAMGLIPGAGGTASLPRRVGRHRTAWLALGGAWLGAPTALAWGLVDEIREPVAGLSAPAR
jgi:enoyl-CoA hydratase/carnithine racemase